MGLTFIFDPKFGDSQRPAKIFFWNSRRVYIGLQIYTFFKLGIRMSTLKIKTALCYQFIFSHYQGENTLLHL